VPWYNPNAKLTKVVRRRSSSRTRRTSWCSTGLNAGFTFEAILVAADAVQAREEHRSQDAGRRHPPDQHHEKMTLGGPIKFNEKGRSKASARRACRT
jgi:branched-chain amino acid transport system substrate-binding protein